MPVPVLLDFPILPLSHWSPRVITRAQTTAQSLGTLQCMCVGRTLCERWRDGQMANMFSKVALSRCRRSLASQLRLSRATRTGNYQQFCQPAVLRTQRPTRFLSAISRLRCAKRHNGNLLAVRAPDQQQHGTVRLMKSRVRGVCSQRLGIGSFVHHLNNFLSRDGTSPGHFLSEQRTLSPERQPRLHTSATTSTKTDQDADIVRKVPVHGWN